MEGDNERSLVLYTQSMGVRILTTGDLPTKSEMKSPPDCDILKVAHHGSKYATSDDFVRQTTPKIALISVGANNRYGHPTARVLEALDSVGAAVYRTDESGCITPVAFRSDRSRRKLIAARHHQTRFPPHILLTEDKRGGKGFEAQTGWPFKGKGRAAHAPAHSRYLRRHDSVAPSGG